jgi:putative membrane protein
VADGLYPFSPYCGDPPTVSALMGRWNLDPVLIAVLVTGLLVWAQLNAERARPPAWRQAAFLTGWALGAAALISPLCALSVSLFSARVGQHMLLTTLVAPLMALGLPAPQSGLLRNPLIAALAFTAAFWVWHAPGPYTATFQSDAVYWAMHLTTFGAALYLWRAVFNAPRHRLIEALAATFIAGFQMALLGAVITFLPRAVYPPHLLTTLAWGLTPLQDQQIAGVIMWVPAGALFAGAILAPLALILRPGERRLTAAIAS